MVGSILYTPSNRLTEMGGEQKYLSSHISAVLERHSVCGTCPLILRFEGLDDINRDKSRL